MVIVRLATHTAESKTDSHVYTPCSAWLQGLVGVMLHLPHRLVWQAVSMRYEIADAACSLVAAACPQMLSQLAFRHQTVSSQLQELHALPYQLAPCPCCGTLLTGTELTNPEEGCMPVFYSTSVGHEPQGQACKRSSNATTYCKPAACRRLLMLEEAECNNNPRQMPATAVTASTVCLSVVLHNSMQTYSS